MTIGKTSKTINLKDGRILGYAEYGSPEGKPVFYFHGSPGSRLDWAYLDGSDVAKRLGARIIAPDRPGFGISDFKRKRQILDWPNDVVELADAINIDRFAVLGLSGGGPYALACALKIPERITNIAVCASMGPANAPGAADGTAMYIPRKNPLIKKLLLTGMAIGLRKDPDRVISQMKSTFPEVDRLIFSRPEIQKPFMDSIQETFHSGTGGYSLESSLYSRPWGFQLQDISINVHIWQGEDDANVPISVGRYLDENIPNSQATFLPNEGHLSIGPNNIEDIQNVLIKQRS
jgi:pimeloyl-ACP methyl ester carboxylesterase